jgi:endonuclease I
MYSDIPDGTPPYEYTFGTNQCATTPGYEGGCYNREHSFPKSWWGGGGKVADTMYTDLFQLIPADSYVNSRRNNYPYGEVNTAAWTSQNGSKLGPCSRSGYGGTVFEPLAGFKGDLARHYFYMATRYESRIASWKQYADEVLDGTSFPCFDPWFIAMLLEWNTNDPVSAKETERNTDVYAIQNNRNPFIDHPEYANLIWGNNPASPLPEPSNYPASFSSHNIHLQWTDAIGVVVPDGYLIRMSASGFDAIQTPADGTEYVSSNDLNVNYGVQSAWFANLSPGTTYYFKMFAYTGFGSDRNYKINGSVPQLQQDTNP